VRFAPDETRPLLWNDRGEHYCPRNSSIDRQRSAFVPRCQEASYEERLSFPMSELLHRSLPIGWEGVSVPDQGAIQPRQVFDFGVSFETVSWSMPLLEPSTV
jgi:hypothetical protein